MGDHMKTPLSILFLCVLLLVGCGGGGGGGDNVTTGVVSGAVVAAGTDTPVAGAVVSIGSGSAVSQADGTFSITTDASERALIRTQAAGFTEGFDVARVTAGETTFVGVRLLPVGVTAAVTVTDGGTVTVPGSTAQVTFPPAGLVPESGGAPAATVNVSLTPINPADDVDLMPGDLTAVSAGGGDPVPLESFGALWIDIRDDSGARYDLQPGMSATIRIPLGTRSDDPPETIPLYFFNEETGLWEEEGEATLQGTPPDQYYEGTVTHFSFWNADIPMETVFVSGCVSDANGQPLANVAVRSDGVDYTGTDTRYTTANGSFRVGIRRGGVATIGAGEWRLSPFGFRVLSNTVEVGPLQADTELSGCLIRVPEFEITSQALPSGTVGVSYSATISAVDGIEPYTWDVSAGQLPDGLTLNASTGAISGTPTTAGSRTFTIRVRDNSVPQRSDTRQFTVVINAVSSGGGGEGTLSVANAPANVGGSFVAHPQFTNQSVQENIATIVWVENSVTSGSFVGHTENLTVSFNATTGALFVMFIYADVNSGVGWTCGSFIAGFNECAGVTLNRITGELTLTNAVLAVTSQTGPSINPGPITLNGTLNFTPF